MSDIHYAVPDGPFHDPLCDAHLSQVGTHVTYDQRSVTCDDCLELLGELVP